MTDAQRITLKMSHVRSKLGEIAVADSLTDELRTEQGTLENELRDLETRFRASVLAEPDADLVTRPNTGDQEFRERLELRSKASLGRYLKAAASGRLADGAEAELQAAADIEDGIPLELWDTQPETEERAVTGAPGTVGINLDRIRPAVFAPSILPRLGVELPRVKSGTYASATISTSTTADAVAKSAASPETAAMFTVASAMPKRVSARMALTLEDIAAVGQANFESALRENLSMALASELDDQGLNGAGADNDLEGLFHALTNPAAPAAGVATFDDSVAAFAAGVDGLWAMTMKDVAIVCGVDTYRLSAQTFRDATGQDLGDMAFADYAMAKYGGWWTNSRMPATANHVQQAILHRMGRTGMRTAVCPHWGRVTIDDIFSGSGKGERYFTMHVLLGNVIVVQPGAYAQVAFRVSA